MMRSLNTAGTGMVAQQQNLDTIANNLANVNTNGFKTQRAEFQDLMYQTFKGSGAPGTGTAPGAMQVGLGTAFSATATNFAQGALQATANPLDLALAGSGFFQVELPDGTQAYTRDGSFKVSSNGELVTNDGYLVTPNITIPNGATAVTVSSNGTVSAQVPGQDDVQELGQLQVAVFANPAGLTRIGQNLYRGGGASGEAQVVTPGEEGSGPIQSGFIEGSNVEIVVEMVRMITAQRAYEINSKAIQTADDMLGVLNTLKR